MQVNKPKLLGVAFIHLLIFITVLGVSLALAKTHDKEALIREIKVDDSVSKIYGHDMRRHLTRPTLKSNVLHNDRFNYVKVVPSGKYFPVGVDLTAGMPVQNEPVNNAI